MCWESSGQRFCKICICLTAKNNIFGTPHLSVCHSKLQAMDSIPKGIIPTRKCIAISHAQVKKAKQTCRYMKSKSCLLFDVEPLFLGNKDRTWEEETEVHIFGIKIGIFCNQAFGVDNSLF